MDMRIINDEVDVGLGGNIVNEFDIIIPNESELIIDVIDTSFYIL
jgi:hypothetical protein